MSHCTHEPHRFPSPLPAIGSTCPQCGAVLDQPALPCDVEDARIVLEILACHILVGDHYGVGPPGKPADEPGMTPREAARRIADLRRIYERRQAEKSMALCANRTPT